MKKPFPFLFILLGFLVLSLTVLGEDGKRKRSLNFDGDIVEGMNRQPLDSLTSLKEDDGDRSKNHIYRRKKKFKKENRELAREIVETY